MSCGVAGFTNRPSQKANKARPYLLQGSKHTDHSGGAERTLWASRSDLTRSVEDRDVNVGSAEIGPLRTGLPAVEVISVWRRGHSTVSVGKPRTWSPDQWEGPQLMVEADRTEECPGDVWTLSIYLLVLHSIENLLNRINQTIKGKPVALSGARRVWARGMGKHAYREVRRCALFLLHGEGDGETRLS